MWVLWYELLCVEFKNFILKFDLFDWCDCVLICDVVIDVCEKIGGDMVMMDVDDVCVYLVVWLVFDDDESVEVWMSDVLSEDVNVCVCVFMVDVEDVMDVKMSVVNVGKMKMGVVMMFVWLFGMDGEWGSKRDRAVSSAVKMNRRKVVDGMCM